MSWAHPAGRGFKLSAELVGTGGVLSWSYDHMMGGIYHPAQGDPEWFDVLGDLGFTAELRDFVEAIRADAPSPVPAAEAMDSLRTALGALESARTGKTIDLTSWEAG
ncbi:MAG: Gfo/Idh/MocA family oxidoreductase [Nocardioidaceae bacterium]